MIEIKDGFERNDKNNDNAATNTRDIWGERKTKMQLSRWSWLQLWMYGDGSKHFGVGYLERCMLIQCLRLLKHL